MAHLHLSLLLLLLLPHLFLLSTTTTSQPPTSTTSNSSFYYNLCIPSTCHNFTLPYPFTLPTPCHDPATLQPLCPSNSSFQLTSPRATDVYTVLSLSFPTSDISIFKVASTSLFTCPSHVSRPNYIADGSILSLSPLYTPGTHLNCSRPLSYDAIPGLQNASCLGCDGQDSSRFCYYAPWLVSHAGCEEYFMYTLGGAFNSSRVEDLRGLLRSGFELRYDKPVECRRCEDTGGRCGTHPTSTAREFVCFCTSGIHSFNCSDGTVEGPSVWVSGAQRGSGVPKAVIAAISASSSVLLLAVIVVLVVVFVRKQNQKTHFNKESISSISPRRYSYSQLKKYTNNFTSKLGEGGFGSVYKGTIHRSKSEVPVAVKILKKSMQTEKQFMNEVTTIGSVHHHNLVGMLGYCVDGSTHALIYEFMENGPLDRYIFDIKNEAGGVEDLSENNFRKLSSKQIYCIALETARGILYLHQGCRNSILHCDIKPANVLLDSNFSARVADFGLARMIEKDLSHISLTPGRGTPGYAAPEMWMKTFGAVTVKSDVYSYGMLLLEMVGRRKNYDPEAADPSQVYFPEWLYNKLERDEFPSLMNTSASDHSLLIVEGEENTSADDDKKAIQRMCLVGLWCIQHIPSNRPAMDRVVQMLEGHVKIGVPPHPFPRDTTSSHKSSIQDVLS